VNATSHSASFSGNGTDPAVNRVRSKTVWIDIDNSPHVPFFLPIISELEKRGYKLILTARNLYQVSDLLQFYHLPCKIIGGSYGKHKVLKVLGNLMRAVQLVPTANQHPALAVSHGSRAQVLACRALGIPSVMMHDYEHSIKTGFIEPDWTIMPDLIPDHAMTDETERILKYPGLKEDVYVLGFKPDQKILPGLGIEPGDLVITLRPPATEAHYHNPEAEVLFAATLRWLEDKQHVRVVTLPRNARQRDEIKRDWPHLIASGRMIIPEVPVDGLNLVWFSDLVISGGGTMNREAAALGVPVYSIFRGKIGAVDQYLADHGRLTLIETVDDLQKKIALVPWSRPASPDLHNRPALKSIVDSIAGILEGTCPPHPPKH
jgi:predicted glycosyltransferase